MTVARRRLLAGVPAAGVGSALFASAAPACSKAGREKAGPENASSVTGPEVHWRMMVSWPKDLSIMYGGAQFVADRVNAMTGGRFLHDSNGVAHACDSDTRCSRPSSVTYPISEPPTPNGSAARPTSGGNAITDQHCSPRAVRTPVATRSR